MSLGKKSQFCAWAQVPDELPWHDWQPKAFDYFGWPQDLVIEKWTSADLSWAKVLDSCNSFTLFREAKVIIIMNAVHALKQAENSEKLFERFKKGPHRILFQSEDPAPPKYDLESWKAPQQAEEKINQKAAFQWIDFVHADQLTSAITVLDEAIQAGQHPLALLQLITRDFRMGRLIHYAKETRIRETELASALRVPGFVIQKWLRRQSRPRSQWAALFDRLLASDLEMKSGAEGVWVLRKLTFDLIQIVQATNKMKVKKIKRSLQPGPLLWTISPSFA